MTKNKATPQTRELAQVALPQHLLATLITSGVIHGNECQSLNSAAKKVIWQSLLTSCVGRQD
ncbi:hypothetical protein Q4489_13875 [Thalassotalea sp. 1_MG-2023]|uniref:hypothetical protein n=1 Tax=Thalassotalea sp. 1_MG-2023 TaxID=3062680 RepID=UPI0026E18ED2|nr:hypothetical protein [Thalassotalea sp. 1_MG-2023]MDO6428104.1 hypothetical protein [Thalassotalea sp. 1_MG-2023]